MCVTKSFITVSSGMGEEYFEDLYRVLKPFTFNEAKKEFLANSDGLDSACDFHVWLLDEQYISPVDTYGMHLGNKDVYLIRAFEDMLFEPANYHEEVV